MDAENPLNLNSNQIAALQRLFQRPQVTNYTLEELRTSLAVFNLEVLETPEGGKIFFKNSRQVNDNGSRMVTFHRSHTALVYIDRTTIRKVATSLAAYGYLNEVEARIYSLSLSYFNKFQTTSTSKNAVEDVPVVTSKDRKEENQPVETINAAGYRLPDEYLSLLASLHPLSQRLAQVAVVFHGHSTQQEKEASIAALLHEDAERINDILLLCRLWGAEKNAPPLKQRIGIQVYFGKSFNSQTLTEVVNGLAAKVSMQVTAEDNEKQNQLVDKIHHSLATMHEFLKPKIESVSIIPVIVPPTGAAVPCKKPPKTRTPKPELQNRAKKFLNSNLKIAASC